MQKRFVLWWLLLFLLVCYTFVTMNMNIAIVSMVNMQGIKINSNKSDPMVCPNTTFFLRNYLENDGDILSRSVSENSGYDWSEAETNMVLSGFYWLNYVSIMPGGILVHKYGSKMVVGYAQSISLMLSSLIPMTAGYGPFTVSCIRALQGILSYMCMPAGLFSIMGKWSPPHERGRFGSLYMIGWSIGVMSGNLLFGYIGQYLHWSYIFHLTSACGIIWAIFWYLLVHDSPSQHPSISVQEKNYIECSLKSSNNGTKTFIPWKGIISSVPLFVCILALSSSTWAWVALSTYSPIYLKNFYGLNSNEIGIVTSVPSIAIGVFFFGLAYINDLIIQKRLLTMTAVRKVFNLIGGFLSMIPFLIIAFTKCDLMLIIFCSTMNSIMNSFDTFGSLLVIMDLSPTFCGVLHGYSGSVTSLVTFLFSAMVNYFTIIYDIETLWKMVFLTTALYGMFTSALFLIFGTSEVQNWNFEDDARRKGPLKESRDDRVEIQ